MTQDKTLSLPFDQYQRYKILKDIVDKVREGEKTLRIIDVGGHPGCILDFLPNDNIIIADQLECDLPQYRKVDALNLPFDDESFDMAVSMDVLEHIPPEGRPQFLKELCRVARHYVVLAAPFEHPQVISAERILFEFIKFRLGYEHQFLKEHFQNGLPAKDEAASFLQKQFGEVVSIPNGHLSSWLLMMIADFYCDIDPKLSDLKGRIHHYYNRYYYRDDNREPCYRYVLIAGKEEFISLKKASLMNLASKDRDSGHQDLSLISTLIELTNLDLLKESYGAIGQLQARTKELELHARGLTEQNKDLLEEIARLKRELSHIRTYPLFWVEHLLRKAVRKIRTPGK